MKAILKETTAEVREIEPLVVSIEGTRAALGGVSRQTVYNFINEGKIKTAKIGARRLVVFESIKDFIASNIEHRAA